MAAGLVLIAHIVGGARADEVNAVDEVEADAGRGNRPDAGAVGLSAAGGFGRCASPATPANSVAANIAILLLKIAFSHVPLRCPAFRSLIVARIHALIRSDANRPGFATQEFEKSFGITR